MLISNKKCKTFTAFFLIIAVLSLPATGFAFGYCGGAPSEKQLPSKSDTKKAYSILKTTNRDSIKDNCMGCHYMVGLISKMNKKQRAEWFRGIKYLKESIKK